jgi:anti-anti-sigma factor
VVECTIKEDSGVTWLHVRGRIDSMSAAVVEHQFADLMSCGKHLLVADLGDVSFVSSAGLRVFMKAQKQLKPVGGEIILFSPTDSVLRVFELSGLLQMFSVASDQRDMKGLVHAGRPSEIVSREIGGLLLQCDFREADPGFLTVLGSQDKLPTASYVEEDVQTVRASEVRFGVGLATLGDSYQEYKHLFGEAVVIDRSLFYYPAVKRPVADFSLCGNGAGALEYRFLSGFGFNGSYKCLVSFESTRGPVELTDLVSSCFELSAANLLGLVIMAESKGVWGMHLKKAPIVDNQPENGEEIFSARNFPDWMDFPVEGADVNNILVGCGIAVREKLAEPPEVRALLSPDSRFHIHAGVFAKEPVSRKIELFESELKRIVTEGAIQKVQHLLGKTRFSTGMVGIIELSPLVTGDDMTI